MATDSSPLMRTGEIGPSKIEVHFSWRMLILLAVLITGPWLLLAAWMVKGSRERDTVAPEAATARPPATATLSSDNLAKSSVLVNGKPGPWGQLVYLPLNIELPDAFITLPVSSPPPLKWFFKDYTKAKATELFQSAGLTPAQLDTVLHQAKWEESATGLEVTPGDRWILGLSPEARQKIYAVLIESAENGEALAPVAFRPEQLDERLAKSGLSTKSMDLLKSLLYVRPGLKSIQLFSDLELGLRQISDESEQRRFIKEVARKPTLLARLKIDSNTDVDAVATYWGVGGRKKDLVPLLNSLRDVDGGCATSIVLLLPQFARERLYTHPYASLDANAVKQDCFWTAFNFFCEEPDNRFNDMQYVHENLTRDYYSIQEPSQLGDLILLTLGAQTAVHAATYIADDIVFTKNGAAYTQPWILMRLHDMIDVYAVRYPITGPIKVLYFRKKSL